MTKTIKRLKVYSKIIGLLFLLLPLGVLAQSINVPEIKIFSPDGQLKKSFAVFDSQFEGSLSLAAGDFDNDGQQDLIVASLEKPQGEIWNFAEKKIYTFAPFDKFSGGMEVTAGNLDGKEGEEIIVGAGYNGGPQIRGFDESGYKLSFFGLDKNQRKGIRVIAKDLGNDGRVEIIGFSNLNQDPELIIFGNDGHLIKKISLTQFNKNGLRVAVGDFDGDSNQEIAVTGGYGNPAKIIIFSNNLQIKKEFFFDNSYDKGLNLAAGDINNCLLYTSPSPRDS